LPLSTSGDRLRVLLVAPGDEEPRALASALAEDGIETARAGDWAAAEAQLQRAGYDAVLVSARAEGDFAAGSARLRRVPGAPPLLRLEGRVDAGKLGAWVREVAEASGDDFAERWDRPRAPGRGVLTIVIPALDEEEAIGETLRRTLDARAYIVANSPVREVDVVVVSDGSSDRTEEIAKTFPEVTVLAFDQNRGYGAAIQSGFRHGRGDWVSFLDADGTCDPRTFAELCCVLEEEQADLVLGSRMGPGSEMPFVRSVGNRIFAWILGALAKRSVRDTASGMRVIRRDALASLYPLPDGLHFTPAMSARALLEDKLHLVEVPMPYAERVGRSKLSVLKDGVRFLTVILRAAVAHRPSRPLLLAAAGLALATLAVASGPVAHWLVHGSLEEPMIYRVMLASLLGTLSAVVTTTAVVSERMAALLHRRPVASGGVTGRLERLLSRGMRRGVGALLVAGAVASSWPGLVEYATSAEVHMHWSRAMLSSLLLVGAAVLGTASFLVHMLELVAAQQGAAGAPRPPDRIRPGRIRS
jgi:hypothetical protein